MNVTLSMTIKQHEELKQHLFPMDGKEAIAFALCGRRAGTDRHRLLVRKILLVPHEKCSVRHRDQITWPTEVLPLLVDEAAKRDMAILKIHSHPSDLPRFSLIDDKSDRTLFASLHNWIDGIHPHASAVMLPDGKIFGRAVNKECEFNVLSSINIVGNDIISWYGEEGDRSVPEFVKSHAQAFGLATFDRLSKLRIAVVGCSGTGSVVIEQLVRLGISELVLVDPDYVEERNLNRILNTKMVDAQNNIKKVDVFSSVISDIGLGTQVVVFDRELCDPDVVRAVAECDVVFGCMDGITGRHLLNRLATFYTIPYFDVGVRLEADGNGGIQQIVGSVHYLQPGLSSFLTRNVFTMEALTAESIRKADPQHYKEQVQAKYIKGVNEKRLAVISVNMFYASLAVNDFLSRIHPYRDDHSSLFASTTISLSHSVFDHHPEENTCPSLTPHTGKGDTIPLLEMPSLGRIDQ